MRESLFESLVGVLVVAVAGIFLFFSLQQRSEAAPADSYQLVAKFNRVDGISAGSDVRMAGVKIGAVNTIALDPKSYKAVVSFTVKKGEAVVVIGPSGAGAHAAKEWVDLESVERLAEILARSAIDFCA